VRGTYLGASTDGNRVGDFSFLQQVVTSVTSSEQPHLFLQNQADAFGPPPLQQQYVNVTAQKSRSMPKKEILITA